VFVTEAGQALVFEGFPGRIAAQTQLCRGPVFGVQFIAGRRELAYACRAGTVGLWDPERNVATPRAQLEGHADLLATSPAGDYLLAGGGNGTVTVIDLQTDLISSYRGHGVRLTSLTPPTAELPFLISGDVTGAVRVWPLPLRLARVVATSNSAFHTAIFDPRSTSVIATTWQPAFTAYSPSTGTREIAPHEQYNQFLEQASTGKTFATYGLTELVEVWSTETLTRKLLITTGHGSVSQLGFIDGSEDFITSGNDGRLLRWSSTGEQTPLAKADQPIDRFAWVASSGAAVFSTADGALWRTNAGGRAISLRVGGTRVNHILAVPAQHTVYAGYANGDVIAIDTAAWSSDPQRVEIEVVLEKAGPVREIAASSDGRTVAVATTTGTIHVGAWRDGAGIAERLSWRTLDARARYVMLTDDGLLVATCSDGTIWLYSIARGRWLCLPTGTVDLGRTAVSANAKAAVALDREGRLIWIDLGAARALLDGPSAHT
jgi:WD40 repeat protein